MPFGLCNAPATFQRVVLSGLKWHTCLVYLDDIIIWSCDFEEHVHRLNLVMDRLAQADLKLNIKKCSLCTNELVYLGHLVNQHGISPNPARVAAVQRILRPKDVHTLRQFLGLASYYRRFIRDFSIITAPMRKLLKNDVKFIWEADCQHAFEMLQHALIHAPVLKYSQPTWRKSLHVDASSHGLGAALYQINPETGVEEVISYASRSLLPAEVKYHTTEQEALALVWAVSYFRPYIFGQQFDVYSDHHSLKWALNTTDPTGRVPGGP